MYCRECGCERMEAKGPLLNTAHIRPSSSANYCVEIRCNGVLRFAIDVDSVTDETGEEKEK